MNTVLSGGEMAAWFSQWFETIPILFLWTVAHSHCLLLSVTEIKSVRKILREKTSHYPVSGVMQRASFELVFVVYIGLSSTIGFVDF